MQHKGKALKVEPAMMGVIAVTQVKMCHSRTNTLAHSIMKSVESKEQLVEIESGSEMS